MRFLHTSDWHLGKKTEGRSRIDEQRAVLSSLAETVNNESVDVVLLAGDVYDTYTPTAEAEALFFDTVAKITAAGAAIAVIAGNHDDPSRLSASSAVAEKSCVFFYDGEGVSKTGRVAAAFRGKDYVVFEKKNEKVFVAMLPYPTELRMKEKRREDESYDDKVKRYILEATAANSENLPVVLMAHAFFLGGKAGESERNVELGGARILPPSVIPENVVYTALGHLHKRQIISKSRRIIYSGSILQYAFDEIGYEKSVTLFDVNGGAVENMRVVELSGYKKLKRVKASSFGEGEKLLAETGDTLVELTLSLSEPPSSEELKKIVGRFPNAVLRINYFSGEKPAARGRALMSGEKLLEEFCKERYGEPPSEEVAALFTTLLNEIEVEDETDCY